MQPDLTPVPGDGPMDAEYFASIRLTNPLSAYGLGKLEDGESV